MRVHGSPGCASVNDVTSVASSSPRTFRSEVVIPRRSVFSSALERFRRYQRRKHPPETFTGLVSTLKDSIRYHQLAWSYHQLSAEAISYWAQVSTEDESVREMLASVMACLNGVWADNAAIFERIEGIMEKLSSVCEDEDARDASMRSLKAAEHEFYKALYKGHTPESVDVLERKCTELHSKSKRAHVVFRNSLVAALKQCLGEFLEIVVSHSEKARDRATVAARFVRVFDDSAKIDNTTLALSAPLSDCTPPLHIDRAGETPTVCAGSSNISVGREGFDHIDVYQSSPDELHKENRDPALHNPYSSYEPF